MNVNQANNFDLDFLKLSCRLCLSNEQDVDLFSHYKSSIQFYELVFLLINIEVIENESFPNKICQECASKLILFYKFKEKCEMSNITLNKFCMNYSKINEEETEYLIEECDANEDEEIEIVKPDFHESLEDDFEDNDVDVISRDNSIVTDNDKKEETPDIHKAVKHQCDQCGKVYKQKYGLIQHKLSHTGIKNHECEICNGKFSRKHHLVIHMRRHNDEKPYVCEICNRGFTKSSDLCRHRRVHMSEKNYECKVCGRRFKRSTDVTSHMASHTGLKKYKCKMCDKAYASHSGLKKHSKVHMKRVVTKVVETIQIS